MTSKEMTAAEALELGMDDAPGEENEGQELTASKEAEPHELVQLLRLL